METLPTYDLFIDGQWVRGASDDRYVTLNPYSGEDWARVPNASSDDVNVAVDAAHGALAGPWGQMTGFERAELMRNLASIIARDADALAVAESKDNGKLVREMRGQIAYLPAWLNYFAGVADKLEGSTIPSDKPNFFIYTRYEPVGVVAAIVPWNSPLLLTMWKLAPALAAGCTFVLKPSDHTPVSALELAGRVQEAGFPAGVFNVITGRGPETGEALVAHPGVNKVAFTGSVGVGVAVAQQAATHLARVSLELGGKSAQLVFDDADLDASTNGVVAGIFAATGQTCIAGSRLLVHRPVHDVLLRKLSERARSIRLGDPLDEHTEMGPLANRTQLDRVLGLIDRAQNEGAHLVCGGASAKGGLFVDPTILSNVTADMEIAQEEVFGPVLVVMPFDDEEEAVALANDTRFGLAAGVWTSNVHRAHRVAHRLRAGTVWINSYRVVAPNAPFGGTNQSGWGRESGRQAVYDYTETKTVWVELEGATRDPFVLG